MTASFTPSPLEGTPTSVCHRLPLLGILSLSQLILTNTSRAVSLFDSDWIPIRNWVGLRNNIAPLLCVGCTAGCHSYRLPEPGGLQSDKENVDSRLSAVCYPGARPPGFRNLPVLLANLVLPISTAIGLGNYLRSAPSVRTGRLDGLDATTNVWTPRL